MIVDLVIFQEDIYLSKSSFARAENWIAYLSQIPRGLRPLGKNEPSRLYRSFLIIFGIEVKYDI